MTLSRRTFVLTAGAALALPSAMIARAQEGIEAIPEGALRKQVAWFVDVLNASGTPLTAAEVEAHFTPAFLAQVPADQVVATVEGLKPALGTVTVERVASGTTDVDAGVILAGETGLRVRLTVWIDPASGLIDGLLIQPDEVSTTPGATAVATPAHVAAPPPATPEVLADYEAASGALLAAGREATRTLLSGDEAALNGMISAEVAEVFPGIPVEELLTGLATNIVSFTIGPVNARFAGHVTPEGITGLFHQGTPAAFELAPAEPQVEAHPVGLWRGDIIIGDYRLGIEVTFSGTAEALAATISIPEQALQDFPLEDVRFERERPLGALLEERALPLGPTMGTSFYGASYAWGETTLVLSSAFDPDLRLIGLSPAMQPPLPPDPAEGIEIATPFTLPFEGAWLVVWGGDNEFRNYHAPTGVQRHACDIVIWRDGATYSGDGTRNEDYYCYGQPLVAPAAGRVVTVVDGYADDVPGSVPTTDPTMHPAGNHVVIEIAPEQFLLMAHLQPGTVAVAEGDEVGPGDPIGLTGNSGNSTEPHLHIHLQTARDMFDRAAIGLPMTFADVLVNGEPVASARIEQGQIIERA